MAEDTSMIVTEQLRGLVSDFDIDNGVQITRLFHVETTDATIGPIEIHAHKDIPKEGDQYPYVKAAIPRVPTCRHIKINRAHDEASTKHWLVTCMYDNTLPVYQIGIGRQPWMMKPVVSFSFISVEEVMEKAYAPSDAEPSIPVYNSAGISFIPPRTVSKRKLQINIRQNVNPARMSILMYLSLINTCNYGSMQLCGTVFPSYTLYMADMKIDPDVSSYGTKYWKVDYTIVADPETWKLKIADEGLMKKTGNPDPAKMWEHITDNAGMMVSEPVPLLNGQPTTWNNRQYLSFAPYRYRNWSHLNLPKTLSI